MLLTDLVTRLEGLAPARNGAPSAAQYEQAMKDAVGDLSLRGLRIKVDSVAVVREQAEYTLPADFEDLVSLERLSATSGELITPDGIIPGGQAMLSEILTINNGVLSISPTPSYSMTRRLTYTAGHVLAEGAYAEMSEREAALALKKAGAECLTILANAAARDAWQYSLGDERVSKERLAAELRGQAQELERQYSQGVSAMAGGGDRAYMTFI